MSYLICLLVAIGVIVFFLVYGLTHSTSDEHYFNYNHQLGSSEFGNSFAAASTSLATVLFFFVILGLKNGLWILWSPITFWIGTLFFNRVMLPHINQQSSIIYKPENKSLGETLGSYIQNRYNSKSVKVWIMMITLMGILSIMLIELYVGVEIFEVFLKPDYKRYALVVIAVVTFIYTGFGGLRAVVKTDLIQYWFMVVVAFLLVLYFGYTNYSNGVILQNKELFPSLGIKSVPLYLNMLCVNILLIPSLLRNWQLFSAAKNEKSIRKGLKTGVKLTVFISLLFVLFGMLFFKNYGISNDPSLLGILDTMASSKSKMVSYVLFPALFAACLMALLSTVDSSLLPIIQCVKHDFLSKDFISKKRVARYINFALIVLVLVVTLVGYFIVFEWLGFDLVSWLFSIFGIVTISSPAIIFACLGKEEIIQTSIMRASIKLFTLIGVIIALGISIFGVNMDNGDWIIQLNTPISIIVISGCLLLIYGFVKKLHK